MHDGEGINARAKIVDYDAGALGEPLQSPDRKRLQNIEDTEEYKAREKRFPIERDGDECDELAGDFVDDYELGIFQGGGACYPSCGGDSDESDDDGCDDCCPGSSFGRNAGADQGPGQDGGYRCPCAGAGLDAACAEESGD